MPVGPLQEEKGFNRRVDSAPSRRDLGNSGRAGDEGGKKRRERWAKDQLWDFPLILARVSPAGAGNGRSTAACPLPSRSACRGAGHLSAKGYPGWATALGREAAGSSSCRCSGAGATARRGGGGGRGAARPILHPSLPSGDGNQGIPARKMSGAQRCRVCPSLPGHSGAAFSRPGALLSPLCCAVTAMSQLSRAPAAL